MMRPAMMTVTISLSDARTQTACAQGWYTASVHMEPRMMLQRMFLIRRPVQWPCHHTLLQGALLIQRHMRQQRQLRSCCQQFYVRSGSHLKICIYMEGLLNTRRLNRFRIRSMAYWVISKARILRIHLLLRIRLPPCTL